MAEGYNLANAYIQILPSTKGIKSNLEGAIGSEAASAGQKGGESLGAALGSTLKKAVAAIGIGKIVKDALDAGGALQQSFGGLETIYGDAAKQAKEFAAQAVTAGISANDYAEQAVSFGAALKQAFGGDVTKAAEAANTAIMDMADNSAKMGTDIQSIQNAYQGFAKQNYTMLDNLKLGYGGTKAEMERLLSDAEKLSGIEYNIDNLGDVYDAIHVIQEDLGLTGVAAAEASTTFTGSFAAMKAAAQNLMANLTLGEDIQPALEVLGQTVSAFVQNNLFPMIKNLVSALPEVLSGVEKIGGDMVGWIIDGITENLPGLVKKAPEIIEQFIEGFTTRLDHIVRAGTELIGKLASGLDQGIPQLLNRVLPMITEFTANLSANFGKIVDAGIDLILHLVQGIINGLPDLIRNVPQIIINICDIINKNMPKILKAGVDIIIMLGKGIIQSIPVIIENFGKIVEAIWSVIKAVNWLNLGKNIIDGIAKGIKNAASSVWQAIKDVCASALQAAKDFFKIGSPSKLMSDQIGQWIPAGIASGIEDNIKTVQDAMGDLSNMTLDSAMGSLSGTIVNNVTAAEGYKVKSGGTDNSGVADAIFNALKGMYIYMDSRAVGQLVAEPVNDTLGKAVIRRV